MQNKELDKSREYFKTFLATQKLRLTNQRQVIFDEFMKYDSHIDIDKLYAITKEIDPNIGLAEKYKFKLTNHYMNVCGVCEKCRSLGKG